MTHPEASPGPAAHQLGSPQDHQTASGLPSSNGGSSDDAHDRRWRRLAVGGLVGPAAFIGAWATGSVVLDGYSPITDAISRLAAVGADTRWLMTAGFLGFTAASIPAAAAVRRAIPGSAWTGVLGTGLSTAVVAALPLDRSEAVDSAHGLAAAVGYILFIYAAGAAASPLRQSHQRALAGLSVGTAIVASTTLAATPFVEASGLLQRVGLTSLDIWLISVSMAILRGALNPTSAEAAALPTVGLTPGR